MNSHMIFSRVSQMLGLFALYFLLGNMPLYAQNAAQKSKPQARPFNACELLTKEEVVEITGEQIDSVGLQEGYGNCIFYKKIDYFGLTTLYNPIVTIGFSRSDVEGRWEYWSSLEKKDVVTGVGDAAVWAPEYDFFVCRVKGGLLMISAGGNTDDDAKKKHAISLAKKAIPRLP